jgi:spore germination protein YaaH
MDNFRYNSGFDDALGASWLTYSYQNKQYQVWYQSQQSFENKLALIKQNSFRGFSAWVLGDENPAIWSALNKSTK